MVAVPILWLSYGAMLFLFTPLETHTIVIIILSCPIFSYLGVQAVEVYYSKYHHFITRSCDNRRVCST